MSKVFTTVMLDQTWSTTAIYGLLLSSPRCSDLAEVKSVCVVLWVITYFIPYIPFPTTETLLASCYFHNKYSDMLHSLSSEFQTIITWTRPAADTVVSLSFLVHSIGKKIVTPSLFCRTGNLSHRLPREYFFDRCHLNRLK